ncbi:MAG TPA: hypothetical protein VER12_15255 [Polyangiaceae bacterium]|nr:hypothetical protein [Polyangiaceae bacterium]
MRTFRATILTASVLACSATALSGCSNADPNNSGSAIEDGEQAGEIGLALSVGSVTINVASYTIVGPDAFSKTGSLDLTNSTTLSATIGGIPAGIGYSISLSASATDGATTCAGSASFDITAHSATPVTVALTCHQPARNGSVQVNGSLNVCPVLDSLSANPAEVIVGHSLGLSASAHDSDSGPAALGYSWSASSGTIANGTSATPSFLCTAPGTTTITVSATDGDPAASCHDTAAVTVKCSLPGAGNTAPSTLAVYGDAPYGTSPTDTSQNLATPAFINSINVDPDVSLVLHTGDTHSGKQYCTEEYNHLIFDMWKAYQDPLVYTPGDNEWTDCNKAAQGGGIYNASTGMIDYVLVNGVAASYANGDPVANLALVRSIFYAQPGTTLGAPKQVLSQAQYFNPAFPSDAKYVENVMFEQSKVLIVTVNVPGGSNNDTDVWYAAPTASAAQLQEVAERSGAALRWLDAAFTQAQANGDVAVLVMLQADMWDPEKGAAHQAEYEPFVQSLATHTNAIGKPVLMFNGDSHVYKTGNPFDPADSTYSVHPGYTVPNFHRIVVHGSTFPLEWLKFTINPTVNAPRSATTFGPFAWSRQIQP